MSEFYHIYEVFVEAKDGRKSFYKTGENPFMIDDLEPGKYYVFKVILSLNIVYVLCIVGIVGRKRKSEPPHTRLGVEGLDF